MSDSEQCSNRLQLDIMLILVNFLAPPAKRQRSFSNVELSVVVVNFSLKIFISQKLFDNFFSSLAWSFIRKVPMYCKNVDLVESS